MTKCDDCNLLVIDCRGVEAHKNLRLTGQARHHNANQELVLTSHFACMACFRKWHYQDDAADKFAGWRAVA